MASVTLIMFIESEEEKRHMLEKPRNNFILRFFTICLNLYAEFGLLLVGNSKCNFSEELLRLNNETLIIIKNNNILSQVFPPKTNCFHSYSAEDISRPQFGGDLSRDRRHIQRAVSSL